MKILISTAIILATSAFAFGDNYVVHPGDDVGNAVNAAVGDGPITFAPGTYTFTTNPSGPAAVWPAGRIYQGNGAILQLSGGRDNTGKQVLVQFNGSRAVTEITGFVCTDAPLQCQYGTFNVHGNTFKNTELGIFVAANSGHIDGNTFDATVQQGIYGYPGDNGTYNNNTIAGTTGDDGIHLASAAGNNVTVSGNVITGCKRIPIEIQLSGTNISVTNNYAALIQPPTGSYMAFSIACGNASGVIVSGNTGVSDKPNLGACVEIMGNNATITKNTSWGFAQGILNGAQGASLQASGNTVYGGSLLGNDGVPWPIAPIVGTNTVLPLSAMPTPPAPPTAQQPGPPKSSAPANIAIPTPGISDPTQLSPSFPSPTTGPSSSLPSQVPGAPAGSTTVPMLTHTISVSIDGSPVLQKQVMSDGSVK